MPPRRSASASTASRCASIAGPGSTTQAGSRPSNHVLVPDSVNGPGLWARTPATSKSAGSTTGGLPRGQAVDGSIQRGGVHAAAGVLAEGREPGHAQAERAAPARPAGAQADRVQAPEAEVAVDVLAGERSQP